LEYNPEGKFVFLLEPAKPNPFKQLTTIRYQLSKAGMASLDLYNVLGQRVRTLAEGEHTAGIHQVYWDGRDSQGRRVSSGVYFYRLETGENQASGKMLYVR